MSNDQIFSAVQTFIQTANLDEARLVVEEKQDFLLLEAVEYAFRELLEYNQGNGTATYLLLMHRDLLRRCRALGIDAAFREMGEVDLKRITRAVLDFARTSTPAEERAVLTRDLTLLLTDEANQVFTNLIVKYADDPGAVHRLMNMHELLRRCQEAGPEEAIKVFDQLTSTPMMHPRPAELNQLERIQLLAMAEHALEHASNSGNSAEAIERVIRYAERALALSPRKEAPDEWARAQRLLGRAYEQLQDGERNENLEQAIHYYLGALEVYTRESFPFEWACLHLDLGMAFKNLVNGNLADNLEQAITHYEQALMVFTREGYPVDWGRVQNNLANAYTHRILGEQADNIERAISHALSALEVRPRESVPEQWAMTQHNLGTAYSRRIHRVRSENLRQAIACYEQALEVRDRQTYPEFWAMTQLNLGLSLSELLDDDSMGTMDRAIDCYEHALIVYTQAAFPQQWAALQNNLCIAHLTHPGGDRRSRIEQAILHGKQALQVRTKAAFPEQWAETQHNLGEAYAARLEGEPAANILESAAYYRRSLEVHTPEDAPAYCRLAAGSLGRLLARAGDRNGAYHAYQIAIRAAETLYRYAYVPAGQAAEAATNVALYDELIEVCLALSSDPQFAREALVTIEAAKGRAFLEQLGQGPLPAPAAVSQPLIEQEAVLLDELRRLEQSLAGLRYDEETAGSTQRALAARRRQVRAELEHLWGIIVHNYPEAQNYISLRRSVVPTWNDLAQLALRLGPDRALVSFYTLAKKIAVLILRAGWDAPRVIQVALTDNELYHRYLKPYAREVLDWPAFVRSGLAPTHAWLQLGKVLFHPLEAALRGVRTLYLIPHGILHVVPLHALSVSGEPLISAFNVVYAPSAATLLQVKERATGLDLQQSAFVAGYTPRASEEALFLGEAQAIAELFGAPAYLGAQATGQALREHAALARYLHLSCHGHFDRQDPFSSAIYLADGPLTTRGWMGLRLQSDLVTLSACQTGFGALRPGDEFAGLSRAILYTGARTVLLTLWSVNASTTRDWMLDFYRQICSTEIEDAGERIGWAARAATLALRQRYADPFYWAPFILLGSGG